MFRASAEEAGVCSEQNGADRGRHTPRDTLKLSPIPGGPKEHILLGGSPGLVQGHFIKSYSRKSTYQEVQGIGSFQVCTQCSPKVALG